MDTDPDGAFVKRWVPELEPVPPRYLDRPERMPLSLQSELGVDVGTTYPYPIVDYDAERRAALDTFGRRREEGEAAFEDPGVRRRASLSPKSRAVVERATAGGEADGKLEPEDRASRQSEQTGLERFTE